MNNALLIDAIVRQTTVLLAHMATAAGGRAALARTGTQVFASLVSELKERGLSNKSIADMFGLTLRTYHNRVSRLSTSNTVPGTSLWEALLAFLGEHETVTRRQIVDRFSMDEERMIRGVLRDLVDSGLVFHTGRGDGAVYRAAAVEHGAVEDPDSDTRLSRLVWVAVKRFEPVSRAQIAQAVPADLAELDEAIDLLVEEGKITQTGSGDSVRYTAEECRIPVGDSAGWEAAIFDHYQAVVTTICAKIRESNRKSAPGEWTGGSTYGFDVHEEHPLFDEVVGFLEETRTRAADLRERVAKENRHPTQRERWNMRVVAYVGQSVIGPDEDSPDG
jgi:hypothetical protein